MNTIHPVDAHPARPAPGSERSPRTGTGSAHAKAILFGEHAVVYGGPAIAVPLHRLEVQAEIRPTPGDGLRIESELFAGTVSAAPDFMLPVVEALRSALADAGTIDG